MLHQIKATVHYKTNIKKFFTLHSQNERENIRFGDVIGLPTCSKISTGSGCMDVK